MFSIDCAFAFSGSCPPVCVCACVCTCVHAHIGLNKPRDAGLVTQLSAIQPGLTLPLLLQAFQCPTTTHFPCWCCWLRPMVFNTGRGERGRGSVGLLFLLMVGCRGLQSDSGSYSRRFSAPSLKWQINTYFSFLAGLLVAYVSCNLLPHHTGWTCLCRGVLLGGTGGLIKGQQTTAVREVFWKLCVDVMGGCNPSRTMAAAAAAWGDSTCHRAPCWAVNQTAQEIR